MTAGSAALGRRIVGLAVAAAVALPLTAVTVPPASAAAPPKVPCGQVELAPVIKADRKPNGKPIKQKADKRGVYVPIIMVPDWHGRARHDKTRTGDFSALIDMGAGGPAPKQPRSSLIGELQRIPGAAVYTFDYRASAGRWVDDPGIGPALGDAIDCVTRALGQKAVLITHGTGGLAARYAIGGPVSGRDRGDRVTTVIGYGSPQTGSLLASLRNTGVGTTASEPRTVLRLLLGACRALQPLTFGQQAPCQFLPDQAASYGRPGGDAFWGDSAQHQSLLPYPDNVRIHAFAGDVTVRAPNLGWFGIRPFRTEAIQLGDLVSATASTTIQAVSQLRAACRFALDAYGSAAQSAGIRLTEEGTAQALSFPETARPCYAPSLPRVTQFAERVGQILVDEIRNRRPLNTEELESLAVPSVCGHPAGTLVGGRLPGIEPGQGEVALASTLFPDRFEDFTTFGDLTGDGVSDTVVVLKCSTAFGPGADVIVAYDNNARMLGSINLSDVTDRPINEIYNVVINRGEAQMRWRTTPAATDTQTTVDAAASFTYTPGQGLTAGFLRSYNATEPAGVLVDAIRKNLRGKRGAKARSIASMEIIDAMLAAEQAYGFGDTTCYGTTAQDPNWPDRAKQDFGEPWPPEDGFAHGDRYCLIEIGERGFALLGMSHEGFRSWRAVEFLLPEEQDGGVLPFPDDEDPRFPPLF